MTTVSKSPVVFSCANGWGLIVGLTNRNGDFMGYFGLNGGSCDWSLLVALIFPKNIEPVGGYNQKYQI